METRAGHAYTQDEVVAIIRRALLMHDVGDGISHTDLEEIAKQTGISSERLHRAIAEEQREHELEAARKRVLMARRQAFHLHLRAYLIVCPGWCLLNLIIVIAAGALGAIALAVMLTPVVAWGVAVALHANSVFFGSDEGVDRQARRLLARERNKRKMGQVKERVEGWVQEVFGIGEEERK